jgi:hypothetical protein
MRAFCPLARSRPHASGVVPAEQQGDDRGIPLNRAMDSTYDGDHPVRTGRHPGR